MPNIATVKDRYKGVHNEELAAHLWQVPPTIMPVEEYDHQNQPWHTQHTVNHPGHIVIKIEGAALPPWIIPAVERLSHLSKLKNNWDSYGALPVSTDAITLVIQVMNEIMSDGAPSPSIVPTAEGGIQLEWHLAGIDMEVEVKSDGFLSVLYEDGANEHEPWEDEIRFVPGLGLPQISNSLQTIIARDL